MSDIISQDSLWNGSPLKKCSQCKHTYPFTAEFFYHNKVKSHGLSPICKECVKGLVSSYNQKNKVANEDKNPFDPSKTKRCPRCQQVKPLTEDYFGRNTTNKNGIHDICKTCNNAHAKAHRSRKPKHPRQLKTHCPQGHPLIEGNLRQHHGRYECLTCHRERERARSANKPSTKRPVRRDGYCINGHPLVERNLRKGKGKHAGACLTCHRKSGQRRYHRNPQKMVEQATAYAKGHRDRINERQRGYRKTEPYKRRGWKRRYGDDAEGLDYIATLHQDPCCYCGNPMEAIDHIVPVVEDGGNHWTNLTSACKRCNSRKHDKSLLEFLLYRLEYPDPKDKEVL